MIYEFVHVTNFATTNNKQRRTIEVFIMVKGLLLAHFRMVELPILRMLILREGNTLYT